MHMTFDPLDFEERRPNARRSWL